MRKNAHRPSDPAWSTPSQFLIVNGAPGLDNAIATVWDGVLVQRSTFTSIATCWRHDEVTITLTDIGRPQLSPNSERARCVCVQGLALRGSTPLRVASLAGFFLGGKTRRASRKRECRAGEGRR